MTISRSILLAAGMLSAAILGGLLFGDRYQIVRDQDYYAWRIDKLTGQVWKCRPEGNCRNFSN